MHEMEESMHRFNAVMGIDESESRTRKCSEQHFGKGAKKTNSNSHPKVEQDDPAWQLLAEKNSLDIQLYEYVRELFDEQKDIVESFSSSAKASAENSVEVPAESSVEGPWWQHPLYKNRGA